MPLLLIEDEWRLAENVAIVLPAAPGFASECKQDGSIGLDLAGTQCYDLIVLDLMLPKLDGHTLLRKIHSKGDRIFVQILATQGEPASVVERLNAGAGGYLRKPFDLCELIARTKALIRCAKGVIDLVLRLSDLELNTVEQTVHCSGRPVDISPMEYCILKYLIHRSRVIVSKRELLERLHDYNSKHYSNLIELHFSNLRRKLDALAEQTSIETLRGRGFRIMVAQQESR